MKAKIWLLIRTIVKKVQYQNADIASQILNKMRNDAFAFE